VASRNGLLNGYLAASSDFVFFPSVSKSDEGNSPKFDLFVFNLAIDGRKAILARRSQEMLVAIDDSGQVLQATSQQKVTKGKVCCFQAVTR